FFVPVLRNSHFKLVVAYMKEKRLEVWDSLNNDKLGPEDADLLNRVGVGLEKILEWETGSISKFTQTLGDVREQKDEKDCGVYVCHFMEYPDLARDKKYEVRSTPYIKDDAKLVPIKMVSFCQPLEWHSAEERYNLAVRILTAKENQMLTTLDPMSSDNANKTTDDTNEEQWWSSTVMNYKNAKKKRENENNFFCPNEDNDNTAKFDVEQSFGADEGEGETPLHFVFIFPLFFCILIVHHSTTPPLFLIGIIRCLVRIVGTHWV
ncbi:hypothetical protein Tco_0740772, partial [Tanacetum coccineum]